MYSSSASSMAGSIGGSTYSASYFFHRQYNTNAGSGVPKVGAPDCIEMDETKLPKTTGAPGLTSCTNASPVNASAKVWATVLAPVTGDMAPARATD
jgi:hypothetical protein